jgi:hypothetical protein
MRFQQLDGFIAGVDIDPGGGVGGVRGLTHGQRTPD